jgi:hypothetical protein
LRWLFRLGYGSALSAQTVTALGPTKRMRTMIKLDPETDIDSPLPVPCRLRIAVIASLIIAGYGLLKFAAYFPPFEFLVLLDLPCAIFIFMAGLCGTYCGFGSFFLVHGFYRLVAILPVAVSFYAILRCAGFIVWHIDLP